MLSLGYRVWSSHHSRNIIAALDDWLPCGLFGSRKGSHAGLVWTSILQAVEEAHCLDLPLSGVVCDVVKAFNCLSRTVIFELGGLLRLPGHVLVGWTGAVSNLARQFQIRNSFSTAAMSCTGFAEGDGLSCVAMQLLDCLLHWWMDSLDVPCRTLTYVDDWQLVVQSPGHAVRALQHLRTFCTKVDLQLDRRKTYVWSLSASGRKWFNLGAHMQLTLQHTNASLQERADSLKDLWDRLRLSVNPYKIKVRALTVAAWPKGLHGVAATMLGGHCFRRLRSGTMRGLQADGAGCSPWVHLGMVESPLCDPGFWSLIQTIRCVRDCAALDSVQPVLTQLVTDPSAPGNTITYTLLMRLQMVGWTVRPDGMIADFLGPFCLFNTCFHEVLLRAQWSWQGVVAQAVHHRPGFEGLVDADAEATRQWLRSQSPEDAALSRKLLNGAHFTAVAKQHWDGACGSLCPFLPMH